MKKNATYQEQVNTENILRLREILKTLPPFAKDYFRAMEPTTSTRTRISYAYDIRIFFHFLLTENPSFKGKSVTDFTVDVLDLILCAGAMVLAGRKILRDSYLVD